MCYTILTTRYAQHSDIYEASCDDTQKKSNPDCLLQKGKYCFIVFNCGTDLVKLNFVVGFLGDITYHTYIHIHDLHWMAVEE